MWRHLSSAARSARRSESCCLPTLIQRFYEPGLGELLVLYSSYSLAQPAFKPVQLVVPADVAVGIINGLLGGLTGLTGIIVTIWCQLRGWPKDVQRTVFQPVNLANIVISAVSLTIAGAVTTKTVELYLLGLPLLLAGLWSGFKLYGKLDDAAFRKVILLLLLVSGLDRRERHDEVARILHVNHKFGRPFGETARTAPNSSPPSEPNA